MKVLKTAVAIVAIAFLMHLFSTDEKPRPSAPKITQKSAPLAEAPSQAQEPDKIAEQTPAEIPVEITGDDSESPKSKIDFASELDIGSTLRHNPLASIPNGRIKFEISNPDGGFDLVEEYPSGPTAHRYIGPNGTLTGERFEFENGDRFDRMYDESGYIRGTALSRIDGSRTDTTYSVNGQITGEFRYLRDGLRIVSKYDDAGNMIEKWQSWDGEQWELFN